MCLFIICNSSLAQTYYISNCGTVITTPGNYYLTTNLDNTGNTSPCITINSTGSGAVLLQCQGYSISDSGTGSSIPKLLYAYNSPNAAWTGCRISYPNWSTAVSPPVGVQILNSYVVETGNSYKNIVVQGLSSTGLNLMNGDYYNSTLVLSNCNGSYVYHNSFHNFGSYSASAAIHSVGSAYATFDDNAIVGGANMAYGIQTSSMTAHVTITNNTISGIYNGSNWGNGLDDGIEVEFVDTTSHTAGDQYSINGNIISNVYDACIEFYGRFTYPTVKNNSCTNPGEDGISGYYYLSLDHLDMENNSLSVTTYTSGGPFAFIADSSSVSWGAFLTNSTISGNTMSVVAGYGYNTQSALGNYTSSYSFWTFYGNTVTNNDLGTFFYSQNSSGVTDGGLNRCTYTVPAGALVCH